MSQAIKLHAGAKPIPFPNELTSSKDFQEAHQHRRTQFYGASLGCQNNNYKQCRKSAGMVRAHGLPCSGTCSGTSSGSSSGSSSETSSETSSGTCSGTCCGTCSPEPAPNLLRSLYYGRPLASLLGKKDKKNGGVWMCLGLFSAPSDLTQGTVTEMCPISAATCSDCQLGWRRPPAPRP